MELRGKGKGVDHADICRRVLDGGETPGLESLMGNLSILFLEQQRIQCEYSEESDRSNESSERV
jgi:hypothetical protein